jgi:arylsulfatase A-like enzyme
MGLWLVRPTSVGAIYLLALTAWAASRGTRAEAALAGQAKEISDVVHGRFGPEVTRTAWAIAATAVCVGAGLGFAAGALVRMRARMARQQVPSALRLGLMSLAVVVALHAFIEAWAMAASPQLYADAWYAQGGALRTVQVFLTDTCGTRGVRVFAGVILVFFLAGPPSQWHRWPGRLARALLPHAAASAVPVGAVASAMLLLAMGPAAAPSSATPSTAAPTGGASNRPNVLILAADSLRADRIDPRITPHFAKLAERAIRFDHAYVSLPRTFPSWVTLLTGRYPHHHGIRSMFPRWEERAKDFDALPARFARAGYTSAVLSDFAGDIFDRIRLGWTRTRVPTFDFRQLVRQRALEVQTPLLPYLQSQLGRRVFPTMREMNDAADPSMLADDAVTEIHRMRKAPFLLTVFFSTAHFPYAAPSPYYSRFTDPRYRGRYKYYKPVGLNRETDPDAADIAQVRALYDGAVASIDAAAARVLDALENEKVADRTIVIVTADHGETLYENGHGAGHGDHLFGDEGTHIPLLILDPRRRAGSQGRRESAVIRDVDLAPTLYELAGIDAPSDLDGDSLGPALDGRPLKTRLAFGETGLWFTEEIAGLDPSQRLPYPGISRMTEIDPQHGDEVVLRREMRATALVAKHRMVRDDRYKLVYVPTRAGARYILFDTVSDPGETRDVAVEHLDAVVRLKARLWSWMLEDPEMAERGGMLVPKASADVVAAGLPGGP